MSARASHSGKVTKVEILLVLAILILMPLSCGGVLVSENVAVRTLETQGFKDVRVVDRDILFIMFRGGSQSDNVRFTCTATNPAGKEVTVYVFAGWPFKGATIRTP